MAGSNLILVNCHSIPDYYASLKMLKELGIHYFTYQVQTKRNVDYVIRNLPAGLDVDKIKAELEALHFNVISVTPMFTTRPTKQQQLEGLTHVDKRQVPMYKITLSPNNDFEKFKNLHAFFDLRIEIRPFTKPVQPSQCMRCMQFGHTKNFCNLPANCSKCGQNHPITECPSDINAPAKCYHCGQGHTATYKGCPVFLKLKETMKTRIINKRSAAAPPTTDKTFPPLDPPNKTYS
ncbi:hypothetical protein J437_LFUL006349 [Ladona fulva]|uniref:Gag-like protein n=1 Tax=Ladona fulva TaxID=123851 RepID=A0A8K0NZX6_LADFU|nr:hypothetical protein J437_LFUL006349 [Ladona fulva]